MSVNNQNCTCEQKIGCCVKDCKYHEPGNVCHAREIVVGNEAAHKKTETFCSTFETRNAF